MPLDPLRPPPARPLRDAALGFVVGVLMIGAYRVAGATSGRMMGSGMDERRRDMHWEPASLTVPIALATLVVMAGLAVRHRWPRAGFATVVLGTAGYLAADGPFFPALIAVAMASFALLLRHRRAAWPWLLALLPMPWAKDVSRAGLGAPLDVIAFTTATGLLWILGPAFLALAWTDRRAAAAHAREDELRRVADAERLRLARDIHDVVGHSLSLISLQAGVALRVLDDDPGQARASLEAIRGASRESLTELRTALGVFRAQDGPAPISPTLGLADIPALVDRVRAGGQHVTLTLAPGPEAPAAVQLVAYRVVQEGLTNAMRHAGGAPVTVSVGAEGGALAVEVVDTGDQAAPPVEGNGLRGLRERVQGVGGSLEVALTGARGVRLRAVLPYAEAP